MATTHERFLLSREGCRQLAAAARNERERQKWIYVELALVLAEATGRRIGAIAGLRWVDISLGESPVRITWRAEFDKDAMLRIVTLPNELVQELKMFYVRLGTDGNGWVFPKRSGMEPWSNELFDQGLRKAEKHIGLPPLGGALWHAYRRKWVTERKSAGWSLVDIAAVGGWKGVDVLERCYAIEDELTMQQVMAEPRKLHGPITGVVKNGGKMATPQQNQLATGDSQTNAAKGIIA